MGIELEYKLAVPGEALLEQILFDPQVAQVRREPYRLLNMATIYYDTRDRRLRTLRWTLRLRQENETLRGGNAQVIGEGGGALGLNARLSTL